MTGKPSVGTWLGIPLPVFTETACEGRHELFDACAEPEPERYAVEAALRLCGSCPSRRACREWAAALPAGKRPVGVVGGRIYRPRRARKVVPAC